MLLVVIGHYIYHGVKPNMDLQPYYQFNSFIGIINWFTMEALYSISTIAVNCFVMISGFFLIEKTSLRWSGILKIWLQTVFYCFLFLVVAILIDRPIGGVDFFSNLLPIQGRKYWFVSIYMGLMVIAPFLSIMAQRLTKRQYQVMLGILLIMNFQFLYGYLFGGHSSLFWFVFLYLMAGYIKLYGLPRRVVDNKGLIVLLLWGIIIAGSLVISIIRGRGQLISADYHGPMFFLSLSVFIYFSNTPMQGRLVDLLVRFAPYTFAVYLIHAHPFWQGMIWKTLIPVAYTIPMALHCLLSSLAIFVVCILIDILRNVFFLRLHIPQLITSICKKLPQL